MRAVVLGLVCFAALSATPAAQASEQLVQFTTKPAGAWVCKKVLSKETCTVRTPARVPVTIMQKGAAAKYVLKRFGYKPLTVRVVEGTRTVSHKLERLDFMTGPTAHTDKKQAALQRAVNPILRQLVLSAKSDYGFNLAGKATVIELDGKYVLAMAVFINRDAIQTKLRRARRISAKEARRRKIIDTIGEDGFFLLLDRLLVAARTSGIDVVALTAAFPATGGVLGEKKETRYVTYFTGSTYSADGRTRTDYYRTERKTDYKLTVKEQRAIVEYSFVVPLSQVAAQKSPSSRALLGRMDIFTNDTRKRETEQVRYVNAN